MKAIGAARFVSRHRKVVGLVSRVSGGITFVPSTNPDLRPAAEALISDVSPVLVAALNDVSFDALRQQKLLQIEAFWAIRNRPVVNEVMICPTSVVEVDGGLEIRYDDTTEHRFDKVMAVRDLVTQHLDDFADKARLFSALGELKRGGAVLPAVYPVSVGTNVVRIVHSDELGGPVAIFTASGSMTISGSTVELGAPSATLASTGGAVCPDLEHSVEFDVLETANREMREETAVGLLGGRSANHSLITQNDGQLTTMQVHDLRGFETERFRELLVEEIDRVREGGKSKYLGVETDDALDALEKAFVNRGASFEFFAEARHLAADAAEAERYVAIPTTPTAFSAVLLHPRLQHRSWTTLMLVALSEELFGKSFADEIVGLMADDRAASDAFSRLVAEHADSHELVFLAKQF